jgi:hypothetical protein
VYVGKARIHVSIDENLLEALRDRATKMGCHQSDVIAQALARELTPELFDQTVRGRLDVVDASPHSVPAETGRSERRSSEAQSTARITQPQPAG